MSNLLAQRKEIKRLEKEDERRKAENEEVDKLREEEEREGVVRGFERAAMGFDEPRRQSKDKESSRNGDAGRDETTRGVKRKFSIDEEEMLRNAKEDRAKIRREIDEEKVGGVPDDQNSLQLLIDNRLRSRIYHFGFLQRLRKQQSLQLPARRASFTQSVLCLLLKSHPIRCP